MRLLMQRREARGNGLKRGGYAGDSGLAWNARLGGKLFVGERLFVAPEIGGGSPGFVLATVNLGMAFRRR